MLATFFSILCFLFVFSLFSLYFLNFFLNHWLNAT